MSSSAGRLTSKRRRLCEVFGARPAAPTASVDQPDTNAGASGEALCHHPTPSVFGETALERAHVDMWIRRVEFVLMQPITAVWVHAHPLTAGLGPQFKDFGESRRELAAKAMLWLDRELTGRDYIAGARFSMADIAAPTSIDFAQFVGLALPAASERLHAWHERVSQRPSALS